MLRASKDMASKQQRPTGANGVVIISGDVHFSELDSAIWRETSRQEYAAGPEDDADFTILTYRRS